MAAGTGSGCFPGLSRLGPLYWAMDSIRAGILALCIPAVGLAQAAPPRSGNPAVAVPVYRGFSPGAPYRAFAERARALAPRDTLRCNTSRNTAQLMECGVGIRDPADGANFYLSAYVLEGKVAMVAFYDSAGFGSGRGRSARPAGNGAMAARWCASAGGDGEPAAGCRSPSPTTT